MDSEEFQERIRQILRKAEKSREPVECESPRKQEMWQFLLDADRFLDAEARERSGTNVICLDRKPDDANVGVTSNLGHSKKSASDPNSGLFLIPFTLFLAALLFTTFLDAIPVVPPIALCCGAMTAWFVLKIRKKFEIFHEARRVLAITIVKGGIYVPIIELARYSGLFSR